MTRVDAEAPKSHASRPEREPRQIHYLTTSFTSCFPVQACNVNNAEYVRSPSVRLWQYQVKYLTQCRQAWMRRTPTLSQILRSKTFESRKMKPPSYRTFRTVWPSGVYSRSCGDICMNEPRCKMFLRLNMSTEGNLNEREVRLLRRVDNGGEGISFELIEVPLDTAPPFTPPSYTWGTAIKTCTTDCNGKLLEITANEVSLHPI